MPFSNTSLSQAICRSGAEVASSGGQDVRQDPFASPSARTEQAAEKAEVSDYSREAYPRANSVGLGPPVNPHPRSRAQFLVFKWGGRSARLFSLGCWRALTRPAAQ